MDSVHDQVIICDEFFQVVKDIFGNFGIVALRCWVMVIVMSEIFVKGMKQKGSLGLGMHFQP